MTPEQIRQILRVAKFEGLGFVPHGGWVPIVEGLLAEVERLRAEVTSLKLGQMDFSADTGEGTE